MGHIQACAWCMVQLYWVCRRKGSQAAGRVKSAAAGHLRSEQGCRTSPIIGQCPWACPACVICTVRPRWVHLCKGTPTRMLRLV